MTVSHSYCRYVSFTSMMQPSCSNIYQRCSVGLRAGDFGGHLSTSKLTAMLNKPVWENLNFVTWSAILPETPIRRWKHCIYKGWPWSATICRKAVVCKWCSALCNEWISDLMQRSCELKAVWPFPSDLWQGTFAHRTTAHWIFSLFQAKLCKH